LTPDELERGKLPPEEILSLPMFKVLIKISVFTVPFQYYMCNRKKQALHHFGNLTFTM